MASEDAVSEYLNQNPQTADWVESVRGMCESDKLWRHRREFILRNLNEVCEDKEPPLPETDHPGLDRLIAYSMVWANHVFTGCRYPNPVMEKALKMAEHIKVTDAPVHTTRDDLVSKVKKRGISSSNEEIVENCKIQKSCEDRVGNSSNNVKEEARGEQNNTVEKLAGGHIDTFVPSTNLSLKDVHSSRTQRTDAVLGHVEKSSNNQSASETKPTSSFNVPADVRGESQAPMEMENSAESIPETTAKGPSQLIVDTVKPPRKLTIEDTKERQIFFNRLYKTVAWKLVSAGGFSPNLNHGELLNNCIESLKSTLDIAFVPLNELADLPQNKTSQENIVCELRCKAVYLGMGCGKTKETAKAVASKEAMKLFLKKKVVVKICKRKYNGREVEDLVLLDEDSRPVNLPPALKNPLDLI